MFVEEMNVWARIVGAGIACLMLLGVAVRAAGSISGERDRGTLNGWLATPLGSDAILFSKWLGSLLSVRWAWVWLFLVWMAAGAVTALHPVAVPLMIAAWFVYAAFLACLGLWFSMVCRTTLRAIVWTLLTGLLLFLGHWLIWLLFIPFFLGRPPDALEWVAKFQVGLTPPLALGGCFPIPLLENEISGPFRREYLQMMAFGIMGIVFWGIAAVILWGVLSARFREMTNRSLFIRARVVRAGAHLRRRIGVASRNGVASRPVRKTAEAEIVDALPAEPDEDAIIDALRVEEELPREG
jgi:ABC-type transport system involved in multi-copper enzyme maturation permease subunit